MMNKARYWAGLAILMGGMLAFSTQGQPSDNPAAGGPSIEGTYKLVSRMFTDGTTKTAPDVVGMLTYTKAHRNFNVYWKDAGGKVFSYSLVSTYTLTATQYMETVQLSIMNDQIGGKNIVYDLSGQSKSAPVTMENGRVMFKMPFDPVTATFEGDKLVATSPDFTDTWQRVK